MAGKVGVPRGEEGKKTAKWRGRLVFPAGKKRKKRLSGGEGWGFPRGRREKNGKVAGKVGVSRGEEGKKTAKWRGRLGFFP